MRYLSVENWFSGTVAYTSRRDEFGLVKWADPSLERWERRQEPLV
jgi:hypothetical protein